MTEHGEGVIGTAFRRSLAAIVIVAVAVTLFAVSATRPGAPERTTEKEPGSIRGLSPETSNVPLVRFTDVTRDSGIDFVHVNGAAGGKYLPETMAGGVAVIDYDVDGDMDLFFVNARSWEDEGRSGPTHRLYANDGRGRFTDLTAGAGLARTAYGMGAAVGDFDNDGDPDLYVTAVGKNRLYRNDGGRFRDITDAAGVAGGAAEWSTSAGFFDMDGDGDLDLFVTNYVKWSKEIDLAVNYTLNGKDRAYGPPLNYEGAHARLFRNDGDGTFTDVSETAGVRVVNPDQDVPVAKGLAVTFLDHDTDGDLDVFVANDTVRNFLFENRGDGTFTEIGEETGFAYDANGNATGAMGIDAAWFRNDGSIGIGVGNFANEQTSLFVAEEGVRLFSCESVLEGLGAPSRAFLTFGLFFFDYDLDGRLDFMQANGHLESEISEVQASQSYRQPAQLFWNAGPGARNCYVPVPATEETVALRTPIVGRGAVYADLDGDGDLDVVLTQTGGRPLVLRNDQATGHHWLRVRLVGKGPVSRDAVGAVVTLTAGGVTQRRTVGVTKSYLSQVEPVLTFGLAAETSVDSLIVRWPDGREQSVVVRGVDRLIVVE